MSTSAPNTAVRLSSDAARVRHGLAAVIAKYIHDLTPRPAAA